LAWRRCGRLSGSLLDVREKPMLIPTHGGDQDKGIGMWIGIAVLVAVAIPSIVSLFADSPILDYLF
jgi:hypothetical protein